MHLTEREHDISSYISCSIEFSYNAIFSFLEYTVYRVSASTHGERMRCLILSILNICFARMLNKEKKAIAKRSIEEQAIDKEN